MRSFIGMVLLVLLTMQSAFARLPVVSGVKLLEAKQIPGAVLNVIMCKYIVDADEYYQEHLLLGEANRSDLVLQFATQRRCYLGYFEPSFRQLWHCKEVYDLLRCARIQVNTRYGLYYAVIPPDL